MNGKRARMTVSKLNVEGDDDIAGGKILGIKYSLFNIGGVALFYSVCPITILRHIVRVYPVSARGDSIGGGEETRLL